MPHLLFRQARIKLIWTPVPPAQNLFCPFARALIRSAGECMGPVETLQKNKRLAVSVLPVWTAPSPLRSVGAVPNALTSRTSGLT